MSVDLVLRTLALCVLLASAETLHGIARTVWLVPRVGKVRALQFSVFSGTVLAAAIGAVWIPDMGLTHPTELLMLGGVLAWFMASFDIVLGRFLLRRPWRKVLDDFNPRTGNWLIFGVLALVFMPWAVTWLRALI